MEFIGAHQEKTYVVLMFGGTSRRGFLILFILLLAILPEQKYVQFRKAEAADKNTLEMQDEYVKSGINDVFIENAGQVSNSDVIFYKMTSEGYIGLMQQEICLISNTLQTPITMTFDRARKVVPSGADVKSNKYNFIYGDSGSYLGISSFRKVIYRNLWPGISLILSPINDSVTYEFEISPFASISDIEFIIGGGGSVGFSRSSLTIDYPKDILTLEMPHGYQSGTEIPAVFRHLSPNSFGIDLAQHGRYQPATATGIYFSLRLGGDNYDMISSIDIDTGGNIYVTGYTASQNFPANRSIDDSLSGNIDCFVTKFSSNGESILFSTYIGGENDDLGNSIKVHEDGAIYVAGNTDSPDFPIMKAFSSNLIGNNDLFLFRLDATGENLIFSTYLGGSGDDLYPNIDVDSLGQIHLAANTDSADFPIENGLDTNLSGSGDSIVLVMNPLGDSILFSTYFGGSGFETADSCFVNDNGEVIVAGVTQSPDFPVLDAFDSTYDGASDGYIAVFGQDGSNPEQRHLILSTYVGGTDADSAHSAVLTTQDIAYITGFTMSDDFPHAGKIPSSGVEAGGSFVAALDLRTQKLNNSFVIGGLADDRGLDISVDNSGYVYVTGYSQSNDFPGLGGLTSQPRINAPDCFLIGIDFAQESIVFSAVFGGLETDIPSAILVDGSATIYVAGYTLSPDFPLVDGTGFIYAGYGREGFLVKLDRIDDTDGDGLTDLEELAIGTDYLYADSDGDGLSDAEEVLLGTDPLSIDTDSDGISDFWEVRNGFDPRNPAIPLTESLLFNLPGILLAVGFLSFALVLLELRCRLPIPRADGETENRRLSSDTPQRHQARPPL